MKVLSFLGTGNYSPTTYSLGDSACSSRFFPVAACELFGPTELILACTDEARKRWWSDLSAELAERYPNIRPVPVPIPAGGTEEEIWSIFDTLVEQFGPGDEVVIDITHGFRSLPVLAVIAAAYLRAARGVWVQRLVYGAYEARCSDQGTPVFDLTPFLALLDWAAAMDLFKRTGNAEPLSVLLRQIQDTLHRTGGGRASLPTRLKPAAEALGQVSEAMRLVRVHEAMQAAHDLTARLDQARVDTSAWARPFAALIDEMRDAYRPFALEAPAAEPLRDLEVQLDMIRWYAEKGWGAEAVALAREWVVSAEVRRAGLDLIGRREREAVERALGDALAEKRKSAEEDAINARVSSDPSAPPPAVGDPLPVSVDVWSQLADLRNDIAHAGMRPAPRPARSISGTIGDLYRRLTPLFEAVRKQSADGG